MSATDDVDEQGFNFLGEKVKDVGTPDVSSFADAETARKIKLGETGLFGMKNSTVGGIADVGNLAVSAFAAYDGYKTAKLNRKALQFNLDTAKAEQARRNSNVSGFNSFGSSAPAQTAMA